MIRFIFFISFLFNIALADDNKPNENKPNAEKQKNEAKKQNEIPAIIAEDLILKPTKEPYLTNGFKIPRGITVTIEPGVTIIPDSVKGDSEPTLVEGKLIIGKKGGAKVNMEIPASASFSGANVEMHNVSLTSSTIHFSGGTEGTFTNCVFTHILNKKTNQPFETNIPQRGIFSFTNCHFINHHVSLPENIQVAKEKIKFELCAFSPRWDPKMDRYTSVNIDSNIFIVGNKCDLNAYIEWKKMNYQFDPQVVTTWYIKDQTMKETLESTLSSAKGLKVQFSTPFTNYKLDLPIPNEQNKK